MLWTPSRLRLFPERPGVQFAGRFVTTAVLMAAETLNRTLSLSTAESCLAVSIQPYVTRFPAIDAVTVEMRSGLSFQIAGSMFLDSS